MNHVVGLLVARISTNASSLGTLIVAGRFLTPSEFGLFAVASALAALPQLLIGSGFYEHILARDPEHRDERTAFFCSIAMGVMGAALLLAVAAIVWWGFGAAVIALLMMGLAVYSLLWSLYISHEARQLRDGHGKTVATISVAGDITAFVALIISVNFDIGVYCLLVNRIVGGSVVCALYWLRTPWPTGRFSRARALTIAKSTWGIAGARVMNWLNGYAGEFVIVVILSAYSVGLFRMGVRLFQAVSAILFQAPSPGIIAIIGDAFRAGPARLSTVVRRTMQLHLAFAIPVFALVGVLASRFIPLLLGAKWMDSVGVLQFFGLSTVQCVFYTMIAAVLTSTGRSGALFWAIGVSCVLGFVGISLGAFMGPVAAAAGHTIATTPWAIYAFCTMLRLSRRAVVSTLWSVVSLSAAGGLMIAAAWGVGTLLGPATGIIAQSTQMMLMTLAGLGAYIVGCWLLAPRVFRLWQFIIRHNLKQLAARFAISAGT